MSRTCGNIEIHTDIFWPYRTAFQVATNMYLRRGGWWFPTPSSCNGPRKQMPQRDSTSSVLWMTPCQMGYHVAQAQGEGEPETVGLEPLGWCSLGSSTGKHACFSDLSNPLRLLLIAGTQLAASEPNSTQQNPADSTLTLCAASKERTLVPRHIWGPEDVNLETRKEKKGPTCF